VKRNPGRSAAFATDQPKAAPERVVNMSAPLAHRPSHPFFAAPFSAYPGAQCQTAGDPQRQVRHSDPDPRRLDPQLAAEDVTRGARGSVTSSEAARRPG
jgi:hypothetical protein